MHGPYGQSPYNGHTYEIVRALATLEAESKRHTELLLQQQSLLIHLPERLALVLQRPPAPPVPPIQRPGLADHTGSLRDWVVAAVAVGALAAAIVGRFPWGELPDLLSRLPK